MAPFTGRKVLAMFVGAFGVIIGVNLFMAYSALSTFPGLDVKNSYVASQNFDTERAAQQALGWTVSVTYEPGELVVEVVDKSGRPADVALLNAIVGRPTHVRDDQTPQFQQRGGKFRAPLTLGKGKWNLRLKATALDGTKFHQRLDFEVKG
ncbi:FixH family protein [Profundibacter sp.]|uniref:FixH family protein n=1 Tax=Profundibacter sp. TaxID=3101071 RepID=UPI003D1470BB